MVLVDVTFDLGSWESQHSELAVCSCPAHSSVGRWYHGQTGYIFMSVCKRSTMLRCMATHGAELKYNDCPDNFWPHLLNIHPLTKCSLQLPPYLIYPQVIFLLRFWSLLAKGLFDHQCLNIDVLHPREKYVAALSNVARIHFVLLKFWSRVATRCLRPPVLVHTYRKSARELCGSLQCDSVAYVVMKHTRITCPVLVSLAEFEPRPGDLNFCVPCAITIWSIGWVDTVLAHDLSDRLVCPFVQMYLLILTKLS